MASKYYNPNLAKGIAGAQSKQYVNYGKDFSEGFKPSMDALQAAKQKQLDDATKQDTINAANALKQNQAKEKRGLELMAEINKIKIDDKGILESFKPAMFGHLKNMSKSYTDNIQSEMAEPNLGFNEKIGYQQERNDLITGVSKYGDSLKRVSASIGEISEAVQQGYLSSANGPEEAALFNSLVNTLKPSNGLDKYTYEDPSGKTIEIDEEGIEDLKKEFVYVTAKDYNSILDEGDKIARATKTTKDGKVYYDFNPAQKERLKFSILQKLDDKDTGDDFLFDTLSNTELSVGPLSLYPNMTKAEIKKQAEEEMVANEIPANLINDKSIMSFLKEKVANGYLKTFENTYPGPPAETTPPPEGEKNAVKQAKTFLSKAKNDVRWEGVTNPSSTLFKNFGGPEFESKITEYGLTAEPITDNKEGELIGWRVYNPAAGFKNYSQDLMFNETLPNIDRKLMVAIGANHPDVFELPVIKQ